MLLNDLAVHGRYEVTLYKTYESQKEPKFLTPSY